MKQSLVFRCVILILLSSTTHCRIARAQQKPYSGEAHITLSTSLTAGQRLTVYIESPKDAENAWIDLNRNGICDAGESYKYTKYKPNQFTLSANEKITIHGEMTYLQLSNNALTLLDLSTVSESLEQLFAPDNQLSSIDLTNLKNLRNLSISNNKLSKIDARNNEKLFMLYASDNEIQSVSLPTSPSTKINRIYLYNNRVSQDAMHDLIQQLPQRAVADKARIYLLDTTSPLEQNQCAPADVPLATLRAWSLYDWHGGENEGRNPYGGSNVGTLPPSGDEDLPLIYITHESIQLSRVAPNSFIELLSSTGISLRATWSNESGIAEIERAGLPQGTYILCGARLVKSLLL
jgi:leucine rich repeat domain protein